MNKKEHFSRGSETASQYGNALTSSSRNTGKGGKETLRVALREIHSRPYAFLLNVVINQASFDFDYAYYDPICWGI